VTRPAHVFVNGVGLDLPAGATALDAVRGWRPDAADAVARGDSLITDSRGLPAPPDAPVQAGAIFRVIPARQRPAVDERDGGDES
jgi:hypothetical protein